MFENHQKPLRSFVLLALLLAAHGGVFLILDAVLSLNRLAALEREVIHATLIDTPSEIKKEAKKEAEKNAEEQTPDKAQQTSDKPTPVQEEALPPKGLQSVTPEPTTVPVLAATALQAQAPKQAVLTHPQNFDAPPSVRLRYLLSKEGDSANAQIVWQLGKDGAYVLTQEAFKFGFSALKLQSVGDLAQEGLSPKRYSDKRFRKSEQAAHFERDAQGVGQVVYSNNKRASQLRAGELTQDRVSVLLQLVGWFRANPHLEQTHAQLALSVTSVDEQQLWPFELVGRELLPTKEAVCKDSAGTLPTVHVRRAARQTYDASIELWFGLSCAAPYQFMPVRLRQTDSSGVTDMHLVAIETQ